MSLVVNGKTVSNVVYNGFQLTKVIYNGTTVWEYTLQDFDTIINSAGLCEITGWKGTCDGQPSTECIIPDNQLITI